MLVSKPCSEATDIGYIFSGGSGCFNPANLLKNLWKKTGEIEIIREIKSLRIDTLLINKKKEYIIGVLLPIIRSQQKYHTCICFNMFSAYYNNNSSISPSKNNSTESHILLEPIQIPPAINRIFLHSQNTALCKINKAYLWPRSKGWMRALLREHSACSD